MNGPPDPGGNPFDHDHPGGRCRKRIQNRLHQNLKRVPGLVDVRYERSGAGVDMQLRADVDTTIFADGVIDAADAYVQVNWWPDAGADDADWFQVHYTDATGFDCRWHRQPNEHVDGLDHYQERPSSDADCEYEPLTLDAESPVGILWEIVGGRLADRLHDRYG